MLPRTILDSKRFFNPFRIVTKITRKKNERRANTCPNTGYEDETAVFERRKRLAVFGLGREICQGLVRFSIVTNTPRLEGGKRRKDAKSVIRI